MGYIVGRLLRQNRERFKVGYNEIMTQAKKTDNIKLPTNEKISDEKVLSVWANRKKSAQKIAREIRGRNRQTK